MREREIIESGMRLFAQQGYHRTSIQEIATEAGVSKGAFYLYFNSKEEFIAKALEFFHKQVTNKIINAYNKELSPEQNFAKQINTLSKYICDHRDFIIMHLHADISLGDHAVKFYQQMRVDNYHWLKDNVLKIYGSKVEKYLLDIIIPIEGIMSGVFEWIVIDGIQIEPNKIGPYVVQRLDEIVRGIVEKQEEPLISLQSLPRQYKVSINKEKIEEELRLILSQMVTTIEEIDISSERKSHLKEVVEVILQKIKNQNQQKLLIEGLLAHFTNIPQLRDECEKIAHLLQIELLK